MKLIPSMKLSRSILLAISLVAACAGITTAAPLKLHAIFTDHMVLQRDKPITVWGWAQPGKTVVVKFGGETAEAQVAAAAPVEVDGAAAEYAGLGRWEVTFPAREASAEPTTLQVTDSQQTLKVEDILIGDVWVMYGQSNMAWPLSKTTGSDIARIQSNLPQLRHFKIKTNEQSTLQDDIRASTIENGGWEVSSPETAGGFSAIGYHFGANLQRSLGVPIGLISNARGGAAIESMVPLHKFAEDPIAKRYSDYIDKRIAEFDIQEVIEQTFNNQSGRAKAKGNPPPERLKPEEVRSWSIPGKSPSDRASIYNGMFGVFKGLNLKGVVFHQGYNNAVTQNCRPKRYRVLTRLMIEGVREDFNDPDLAFCIIGLCAGSNPQNVDDFETESIDPGAYIREAQRLGLADVENQKNLIFIPGYDVIYPGLHPARKQEHGERAHRWALANVYPDTKVGWSFGKSDIKMISCEPQGDMFVLKFDGAIISESRSMIPEGFSLAGEDGKFYMAHARYAGGKGHPSGFPNEIRVWSPLVPKPVALRYAWARAPMGNLKFRGHRDRPLPSFRTDSWDFPESEDPSVSAVGKAEWSLIKAEALERLNTRRTEEAKRGVEILQRIEALKAPSANE